MAYQTFQRFLLDPRNENEVLELALTRAYQASGTRLNAFNPGSPLMILLESLVAAHMEFLFWFNSLPEAMLFTYLAQGLGAGRSLGTKASVSMSFALSTQLGYPFVLPVGTKIYSKSRPEVWYELVEPLTIAPGAESATVTAQSGIASANWAVKTNELEVLGANYAFLSAVTNPAPSTPGQSPETLTEVSERVLEILTRRNPVSDTDWHSLVSEFYPDRLIRVTSEGTNLAIYIEEYTPDLLFESTLQAKKYGPHPIEFKPLTFTPLEIVAMGVEFEEVTLAANLQAWLNSRVGNIQPIDIYEFIAGQYPRDFTQFRVSTYPMNLTWGEEFSSFEYNIGDVLLDSIGNYYLVSNNFNPFYGLKAACDAGQLIYHPTYSGLGVYTLDDLVLYENIYYRITQTGYFDPETTTNWVIITPEEFNLNVEYFANTFFVIPTDYTGYYHGFRTVGTFSGNENYPVTLINPPAKLPGQEVGVGEYWHLDGQTQVLYLNNTDDPYTVQLYNPSQTQVNVKPYPLGEQPKYSSKYTVGNFTFDFNHVYITSAGTTKAVPQGFITQGPEPMIKQFGHLILYEKEIYEVKEAFIPTLLDSMESLIAEGKVDYAFRPVEMFDYLPLGQYRPILKKSPTTIDGNSL